MKGNMTTSTRAAFLDHHGLTPGARRIALISCSAQKLDRPAPARDLYTSTLFRKSVGFAATHCDGWLVLSAKHGLVDPGQVLDPYDEKLTIEPAIVDGRRIPSRWGSDVAAALVERFGIVELWSTTFVVLAGGTYERNLRALAGSAIACEYPLAGKQIGQRLQWLTQQVQAPTLDRDQWSA